MLGRTATSVFSIALLAGLSILGNCGKASAGFLPSHLSDSGDLLFSSESDRSDLRVFDQTSSCASPAQVSDNSAPSPDQPNSPLASRSMLSMCFGILAGRGSSSFGGAGGTNNCQNCGSGPPLVGATTLLVSLPHGIWDALIDPDDIASTSMTSRLFRPPRLS